MKVYLLFAVSLLPLVSAMSGGAPEAACETFQPLGHAGTEPQELSTAQFDLRFKHIPRGGKVLATRGEEGLELVLRPAKDFKGFDFHKIHITKMTYLTKFIFSKSHIWQNSHFQNHIP